MNSILYPFDPTATKVSNHIPNETHLLSESTAKMFTLELGSFYTKSVVLRKTTNGAILNLGVDYGFAGFDPEITALTNYEVASAIHIKNDSLLSDVVVSYQAVGGPEGINSYLVKELQDRIDLLNTGTVPWANVKDVPEFFPVDPDHAHSVLTDLTELDSLRNALLTLNDSLVETRTQPNSLLDIKFRLDRTLAIIGVQRNDINRLALMVSAVNGLKDDNVDLLARVVSIEETFTYIDQTGVVDLLSLNTSVNANAALLINHSTTLNNLTSRILTLEHTVSLLDIDGIVTSVGNNTANILSLSKPNRPGIIHPVTSSVLLDTIITLQSTPFISDLTDTHSTTVWEISKLSDFSNIEYTLDTDVDLVTHTLTNSLVKNTVYYIRCKHVGVTYGDSNWSPTESFKTVTGNNYINVTGSLGNDIYNASIHKNGKTVSVGQTDDNGSIYGIVSEYDEFFNLTKSVKVGGVGTDVLNDIIVLTDGTYIGVGSSDSFGTTGTNGYIVHLDANLNILDERVMGKTGSDIFTKIKEDNDGNFIIIGTITGFGNGGISSIVLKIDNTLSILFEKIITGSDSDIVKDVVVDGTNYVCVGYTTSNVISKTSGFIVKLLPDLTVDMQLDISGLDNVLIKHIELRDNTFLITGESVESGVTNGYLAKLDSSLSMLNERNILGGLSTSINAAKLLDDGSVLSVGTSDNVGAGGLEIIFIKTNAALEVLSTKILTGVNTDIANDLLEINPNTFLMTGQTYSAGSGGSDGLLVTIDADLGIVPGVVPAIPNLEFINPSSNNDIVVHAIGISTLVVSDNINSVADPESSSVGITKVFTKSIY